MEIEVKGLPVHYETAGSGEDVLLLHGWGNNFAAMLPMLKHFSAFCRVTAIDLPGLGQTPAPDSPWSVYDYADLIEECIKALGLQDPVILGHSFGGRLSIILGSRGIGKKLILVDAAGILPKRGMDYYAKVYSYKAAKKVMSLPGLNRFKDQAMGAWQKKNGSSDYAATEGVMRQIFVKAVNEDLQPLLSGIKASTLLIWGDQDTATPLADGKLMEQLIPDAGLVVLEGCGHFSFLDAPGQFYAACDYFLQH